MLLSDLADRLNSDYRYVELEAWDDDIYNVKTNDNYFINLGNRTIILNIKLDITSRPKKAFKAKVSIQPYEESVAKVVTAFYKPTSEDPNSHVKEGNCDFLLLINL